MPKRKRLVRFPSDEIQGKGSWVIVAKLTVEEMREIRKTRKVLKAREVEVDRAAKAGEEPKAGGEAIQDDLFELGVSVLKSHVKEWNWVWDNGDDMPQPKDDPSVIDKLTDPESTFLTVCIQGPSEKDVKN